MATAVDLKTEALKLYQEEAVLAKERDAKLSETLKTMAEKFVKLGVKQIMRNSFKTYMSTTKTFIPAEISWSRPRVDAYVPCYDSSIWGTLVIHPTNTILWNLPIGDNLGASKILVAEFEDELRLQGFKIGVFTIGFHPDNVKMT